MQVLGKLSRSDDKFEKNMPTEVRSRKAPHEDNGASTGQIASGIADNDDKKRHRQRLQFSKSPTVFLLGIGSLALLSLSALIKISGNVNFDFYQSPPKGYENISDKISPRMISYVLDEHSDSGPTVSQIRVVPKKKGGSLVSVRRLGSAKRQKRIAENSNDYDEMDTYPEKDKEDCQLLVDWQETVRPACNTVHEFDAATPTKEDDTPKYKYLTNGYYRDVWSTKDDVGTDIVFKPMRFKHEYTFRNFDRMRRDTLTMDRLAGEKYILNIYSACGTSGFFEFASGGDIEDAIWPYEKRGGKQDALTQLQKLHIATQAAMALASVHNIDMEGQATVAHTDMAPGQYIKVGGIYKLNDFNRARFLRYSKTTGKVCKFTVGNNAGKNRSPEEYAYEGEDEKVDVYSLGNIFYMLLQEEWPFDELSTKEASRKVKDGIRPSVYEDLWKSTDPVNKALREGMFMCHNQNPADRKTAREVANFFKDRMREIDPGRLEEWGDA